MSKNYIFSSESVGEGHPDKVCDTISDAVLDACLAQDKHSRVACETYAKSNLVVVGGEITTSAKLDFAAIAREAIRGIAREERLITEGLRAQLDDLANTMPVNERPLNSADASDRIAVARESAGRAGAA